MGINIINAGSNPNAQGAAGSQYGLLINPDGSINTAITSGTVNAITDPNRSSIFTARYTANSGVQTFFSGQSIPNGFELVVKALSTNVTQVGVGSNFGVIGSAFNLYPNDAIKLGVDNTNRLQFVTITNGDGVELIAET